MENHVRNILGKLGFTSRAQVAVWVAERPATYSIGDRRIAGGPTGSEVSTGPECWY